MPLQPPSPFHQHIALPERTALLLSMLAPWPRRGRELLVIGCGAGHVLPPLWQSGFDLSACETSPALREQARRRAPQGVEIEAASPDWLPFADNSFDWVLLRADELPPTALPAALSEACRVAACGLALTFWNSASLPWLTWRLHGRRHAWPGHCLPFWTAWRLLAARPGRLHAASCLWRPACRWHHGTHVHAAALSRLRPASGHVAPPYGHAPAPASAPPSGYRPPRHGVRLPAHHRPAPGTKTASLNHRKNFFCSRRPQRRGFSAFLSRPQRQTSLRGLAAGTALHYGGTS